MILLENNFRIFLLRFLLFLCILFQLKTLQAQEQQNKKLSNSAASFIETDEYVHSWIKLPQIQGTTLEGKKITQSSKKGISEVLIFIASWCIQCQQLTGHIKDLEKKYKNQNTRFTYIFSHDLLDDAKGFAKEYGLKKGIIAKHDILKAYHNPELPSIYLGDRHGWLLARFLKATPKEIKIIDDILNNTTSY